MSALRVELFFDEEARNWHYRVPALHINGGGTATREDAERESLSAIAFALTVARHVSIDWLRRQRRFPIEFVPDLDDLEVMDERPALDEALGIERELELVAQLFDAMPSRRREVFALRRLYGWSHREISRYLRISPHTIEQHVTHAIVRLRHGRPAQPGTGRPHAVGVRVHVAETASSQG